MSLILNQCIALKTLNDIEVHIFDELVKPKSKIAEIVELNEYNVTTRYWRFNKKFQIIKEIDNRPDYWPSNIGWKSNTRQSKKIYEYEYQTNGKINTVSKTQTSQGEVVKTTYLFTYPNENTIREYHKLQFDKRMNFDFELTYTMSNSRIIEQNQTMKNFIGDGHVQTDEKRMYVYDELLKEINHYFKVNSLPLDNEEDLRLESLGAKTTFAYDSFSRLKKITELEYLEEGGQIINRELHFKYLNKSDKIAKIILKYGENYTPRELEYIIEYTSNGDLKTISVNGKICHYIIKR